MTPEDAVIETSNAGDSGPEDKSVLDLILDKPQEKKEEKTPPSNRAAEAEDAPEEDKDEQDKQAGDEGKEAAEGAEPEDDEKDEEEKSEEDTPDEDDLDEYLTDVVIDGKTVEVKLGDLKNNYSGNKFTEANMQKAVEARKAAETQANVLFEVNKQRKASLEGLNNLLKLSSEPNIDWEALKKSDLNAYLLKKEEQRDSQSKQSQVKQEVDKINAEQAEIQAHATQRYLDDQAQLLVTKLPDLADPKKAPALMAALEAGAEKHFSYTKQEFNGIVDHRALMVLKDAVSWRDHQASLKTTKDKLNGDTSEKKVLIRPTGQKSSQASTARRLDQAVIKRARESGKADDVAATLIVRKKG